ncbi:MAG: winged helix-turn-helix transcriptional regulator [Candidatus Eremiobacteraeota bacterium]|nr:winged helix-turn-helix transcriptional regulator [Candidatus Eremiobacteraeota bacterium]
MYAQLDSRQLDATFSALSDATRRSILVRLARGAATVNELTESFSISQPAISRHLKVLEKAGLIRRSRDAQRRPARVRTEPIRDAAMWIERYGELWERTYRRLDVLLADELKRRTQP